MLEESAIRFSTAIGLTIAAVSTRFTGRATNRTGPFRKVEEWRVHRELQLGALAVFALVSGSIGATS
ncbi:hypothetical protein [Gulosibacter sediminis]|uniref:hypothetical protein n=1 Tax=Gulosibacter sediminis TaxID=1729695 RepID=UPI0024A9C97C|nr:hypothetical protein [Gulosibacter sediminis]